MSKLLFCKYCGGDYLEADFEITKVAGGKTYRRRKCKFCKLKAQRQRQIKLTAWFVEHKKSLRCQSCGIDDYRVLTFHPRDPNQKVANVSDMSKRGWSLRRVQEEMEKCTILCANCHLIEHHKDVNGV